MRAGRHISAGIRRILAGKRQEAQQNLILKALFIDRDGELEILRLRSWLVSLKHLISDALRKLRLHSFRPIPFAQGQQAAILWPLNFQNWPRIHFAHTSFNWKNLASHNAGVTVVIVGFSSEQMHVNQSYSRRMMRERVITRRVAALNAYLIPGDNAIVGSQRSQISACLSLIAVIHRLMAVTYCCKTVH